MQNTQNHKKILISKLFEIDILDVMLGNYNLDDRQNSVLNAKIKLLESGMPLDYVIGFVEVLDLKLELNNSTLIPREETLWWLPKISDKIIDVIIKISQQSKDSLFVGVDVGTGSGLIGLYLAMRLGQHCKDFYLLDIDQNSLKTANKNANQNSSQLKIDQVKFVLSDGLSALPYFDSEWFLVANLPYLPIADIDFAKEYNVSFEPVIALYSGCDGLELYRRILTELQDLALKNQKLPFLVAWELDPRNIQTAKILLEQINYKCEIWVDQGKYERVLIGCLDSNN